MKLTRAAISAVLGLVLVMAAAMPGYANQGANATDDLRFSRDDYRAIWQYFYNWSNLDALSDGMKQYLNDNWMLPGGFRALTRGKPLSKELIKLVREAPKDLKDSVSVGGEGTRLVMIGHNVVLLNPRGQVVLDYVPLQLPRL